MMKCQHCGSTDIIAIQGQNYCLNCGYAVTAPTAAAVPAASTPKKPNPRPKVATRGKAAAGAQRVAAQPEIVPSTPARRQQAQAADMRSAVHRQATASTRVHPLRFSLVAALTVAVIGGGITAASLWLQVDSDIGAYLIGATVIGLGIYISLAHIALLYGRSRSQDGRPAPRVYWWMAARNGWMDVINVQLIAVIAALIVIGLGLGVARLAGTVDAHWGMAASIVVAGLLNLALAWALLGVYASARLATPAVVIGGLSATEAVRVGWRLYRQAGGHLVAAAVEAALGRALAAAAIGILGYVAIVKLAASSTAAEGAGGGVAVALVLFCACMLTLEVDTKLWLAQYRHLVTLCPPAERIRLLTGRVQSHVTS